ncbi:MAG TPA: NrfD/PsrC family molybdoenzyme membrane anchor subunit [Candidatus Dormibacteraeota bacterium]|nr:NrfD/PsrC family molybdoenzyme membrane anchor subunit [Candidatus Dormibacteraeota bacterium]
MRQRGKAFGKFVVGSLRIVARGGTAYWLWLLLLAALILIGVTAYARQLTEGLILTNMRDQVSWAFYIGNFTFLVGVAAAAVVLVIPAYIYHWGPIKEIVVLGELLAVSACVMAILFVAVDMGHPERVWHLIPGLGYLNLPTSLLAWDVVVLNAYLLLNLLIVTYLLFSGFRGVPYRSSIVWPLVILSIPLAISLHTVTAFVYSGLAARPFWNAAILAPRFLVSAFCSGPAILLIMLQVLRRTTPLAIKDEAIWKIAELMAYAMGINLFLQAVDLFKEFYSNTEHTLFTRYLLFGLGEHRAVVPYAWLSMAAGSIAFLLFLFPTTRRKWVTLNLGCVLIYAAVYLEKGMCLVIPGLTPDTLGEIYEYAPTSVEWMVAAGIFGVGFLLLTLMSKVAIEISLGRFTIAGRVGAEVGVT